MNLIMRMELQKPLQSTSISKLIPQNTFVNNNSAIDNYIIAKVVARDRFVLRPQEYELFIKSAIEDIETNLNSLLEDF